MNDRLQIAAMLMAGDSDSDCAAEVILLIADDLIATERKSRPPLDLGQPGPLAWVADDAQQLRATIARAAKIMGCEPGDDDDFLEAVRLLVEERDHRLTDVEVRVAMAVRGAGDGRSHSVILDEIRADRLAK
jgi:hypothetical protein